MTLAVATTTGMGVSCGSAATGQCDHDQVAGKQSKEDAEKRFWRLASMYEARYLATLFRTVHFETAYVRGRVPALASPYDRYQNWSSCGAAATDPEGNSGDVLCLAEGLLALRWMGVDIHSRAGRLLRACYAMSGLQSVWDGVRQALAEQCEVCSYPMLLRHLRYAPTLSSYAISAMLLCYSPTPSPPCSYPMLLRHIRYLLGTSARQCPVIELFGFDPREGVLPVSSRYLPTRGPVLTWRDVPY
eukprot:525421-Rhodomonas_salina.4